MPLHRVLFLSGSKSLAFGNRDWAGTIRGENKVARQNQYRDLILVIAEIAETDLRD
jgi:hypothetical protein